jgi:hypothetical protein
MCNMGNNYSWCPQCGCLDSLTGLVMPDNLSRVINLANLQPGKNDFASITVEAHYQVRRWARGQPTATMTIVAVGGRKV